MKIIFMNPLTINIEISTLLTDNGTVTWLFGKSISRDLKNLPNLPNFISYSELFWYRDSLCIHCKRRKFFEINRKTPNTNNFHTVRKIW